MGYDFKKRQFLSADRQDIFLPFLISSPPETDAPYI